MNELEEEEELRSPLGADVSEVSVRSTPRPIYVHWTKGNELAIVVVSSSDFLEGGRERERERDAPFQR